VQDDGFFGEGVAAGYDVGCGEVFSAGDIAATVDFLATLAQGGRVLELAIGTGRIALPLAARGVEVHGIDLSRAMVDQLRAKPGGESIPVTMGDLSSTRVEGAFDLVYLVFNTIENLTTQAAQVACFRNAAAHLEPGGCFVVEVEVPDLQRIPYGETIRPWRATPTRWDFDEYDVVEQGLVSHHFSVVDGSLVQNSIPFRYVWPAELDLMAELAGMRRLERWGDWDRRPFTNLSRKHVSVWESV